VVAVALVCQVVRSEVLLGVGCGPVGKGGRGRKDP
jgi:hypothetical protein